MQKSEECKGYNFTLILRMKDVYIAKSILHICTKLCRLIVSEMNFFLFQKSPSLIFPGESVIFPTKKSMTKFGRAKLYTNLEYYI